MVLEAAGVILVHALAVLRKQRAVSIHSVRDEKEETLEERKMASGKAANDKKLN